MISDHPLLHNLESLLCHPQLDAVAELGVLIPQYAINQRDGEVELADVDSPPLSDLLTRAPRGDPTDGVAIPGEVGDVDVGGGAGDGGGTGPGAGDIRFSDSGLSTASEP